MARKAARTAIANSAPKVKKTLSLDVPTARRLAAYAGFHGLDESEVVASAVGAYIRGFAAYQRDAQAEGTPAPQVRLAVPEDVREAAGS